MKRTPRDGPPERQSPDFAAGNCDREPRGESKEDQQRETARQTADNELQRALAAAGSASSSVNSLNNVSAGTQQQQAGTSLSEFHNLLNPLRQMQQPQSPPSLDLAGQFVSQFASQHASERLRLGRNLQLHQLLAQRGGLGHGGSTSHLNFNLNANSLNNMNPYAAAAALSRQDATIQRLLTGSSAAVTSSLLPSSNHLPHQVLSNEQHRIRQLQAAAAASASGGNMQATSNTAASAVLLSGARAAAPGLNAAEFLRWSQMRSATGRSSMASSVHPQGSGTADDRLREMLLPPSRPSSGASLSSSNATSLALPLQRQSMLNARDSGIPSLAAPGVPEDMPQLRLGSLSDTRGSSANEEGKSPAEQEESAAVRAFGVAAASPDLSSSSSSKGSAASNRKRKAVASSSPPSQPPRRRRRRTRDPVVVEGVPHHTEREYVSLGVGEDPNWLSEFQCFVRDELMEVIQASQSDVLVRSTSKSILPNQVGVRCRFCAHLAPGSRVCRSSAFPSSLDKLYQSFSMMVRDHFIKCPAVPSDKALAFQSLKQKNAQGATDSKQYWVYAAKKLGMVDAKSGIERNEESIERAAQMPPYGTTVGPGGVEEEKDDDEEEAPLAGPDDQSRLTPFLYDLLRQLKLVHLLPSERVGKRKGLPVGLEGLGCQYCSREGRLGFSRCFPLRRRALPSHVLDLYRHCLRCPLFPEEPKEQLKLSFQRELDSNGGEPSPAVDSYSIIWTKLGRQRDLTTS
ncbi:expressed unknown protein [Seminavis robusta]|uniref:Uncharacterized protein n=1 Tax=Seminavis robusta TaxID=568900 RepID=A0A9N8E401_9STRA|nr:expressed unknown protein [Seminavis robusta]|eukprot:Sro595_g172580.1 n/a (742) ;mRNA; f:8435-10660